MISICDFNNSSSMYELFFSHMLCKIKWMVSSFKSIFLESIPHLAFSLSKTHSIDFLADLNILLKTTSTLLLQ